MARKAATSPCSETPVVATCLLKVAPGQTVIAEKFLASSLQIQAVVVGTELGAVINGDGLHSGEKNDQTKKQQKKSQKIFLSD